jgi:hypothetical protein
VPGVLTEENKRRKLLKELGVEIRENKIKAKEEVKGDVDEPLIEEVKSQMPMTTPVVAKAIN